MALSGGVTRGLTAIVADDHGLPRSIISTSKSRTARTPESQVSAHDPSSFFRPAIW